MTVTLNHEVLNIAGPTHDKQQVFANNPYSYAQHLAAEELPTDPDPSTGLDVYEYEHERATDPDARQFWQGYVDAYREHLEGM